MADRSLSSLARSPRALVVGICGLLAMGVVTAVWRQVQAHHQRDALVAQMRHDLQQDRACSYRHMLDVERQVADVHGASVESQSLAAYAATILALEHHQGEFARHARRLLAELAELAQADPRDAQAHAELRRAAIALMAWGDGDADQSRSQVELLKHVEQPSAYEQIELMRLEVSLGAPEQVLVSTGETLASHLTSEARGWAFLGWRALERGDHALAQQHLDRVLAISPEHERARLGKMWLTLGSLRCQKNTDVLLATSKAVDTFLDGDALTPPERSMALAVRARAEHLSGEAALSERDLAEAKKLDPTNPLLKKDDVLPPARPD